MAVKKEKAAVVKTEKKRATKKDAGKAVKTGKSGKKDKKTLVIVESPAKAKTIEKYLEIPIRLRRPWVILSIFPNPVLP